VRARTGLLLGALSVGLLDAMDAMIFFGLRNGVTPFRIFRGIASGLLGRDALTAGTGVALLGVALHFTVAFGIVATYFGACRVLSALSRRPLVFGPVYGIAVYVVMNSVVIPLSAIGPRSGLPPVAVLANGLLIHLIGVGLPTALFAHWSLGQRTRSGVSASPIPD